MIRWRQRAFSRGLAGWFIPSPGISQNLTEIAQQSWKRGGIDVEIVPSTNIVQDFFTDHKTDMGAANVVRGGLEALSFIYTPGHLGDVCDYQDPKLTGMINELSALPSTDPKATQLWHDAQNFVIRNALSVYALWLPTVLGYDASRVGGLKVQFLGVQPSPDFLHAYVKK